MEKLQVSLLYNSICYRILPYSEMKPTSQQLPPLALALLFAAAG